MEAFLATVRAFIPKRLFASVQPTYHWLLSLFGAILYRFPSRHIIVIGVTGTKGKSSVTTILTRLFEEAGYRVASASTIRFAIAGDTERNLFKMTMPGRFFLQHFLRKAVDAKCDIVILEMTSEGARVWRHSFIELDTLIVTNLTPEHIESHGSFEAYKAAKLRLRDAVVASKKTTRRIIANRDDPHAPDFLDAPDIERLTYGIKDAEPYATNERGVLITLRGTSIHSPLVGVFNIYNILAASTCALAYGVPISTIKRAVESLSLIEGRAQKIECGQPFAVIVDYAHTPESLEAIYAAFPGRKIGVLGNTGGGRDRWKRPTMAGIADRHCDEIILTNEDPYDEDPRAILEEMRVGITNHNPHIILDRREAIRKAIRLAHPHDTIVITGKGTDPYIMGPHGSKQVWSDAEVVREELMQFLSEQKK